MAKKDNTLLYVGIGAAALLFLGNKNTNTPIAGVNSLKRKLLIISSNNPLSNQLAQLTGDRYNLIDFEEKEIDGYTSILKHINTATEFIVMPERYYNNLTKNELKKELDYANSIKFN